MKKSALIGILGMAMAMEGMGSSMDFKETKPSLKTAKLGFQNTILTPKQEKERAKNKRARKARRLNRV